MKYIITLISSLTVLVIFSVNAQPKQTGKMSPLAMSTYKSENTYVKVTYCQPSMRGRKIFGELVPFGKVWRTGADEATEVTFTRPVMIMNQKVEAGTYTLFTVPQERAWAVVLNTELGQWGAFKYDEKKNAYSFKFAAMYVKEATEVFSISFEPQDNEVHLTLQWENTKVAIPISFISDPAVPAQMD